MEHQRALVTGASSGIGMAVARRLAARGVEVWLGARRAERLASVVAEIEQAGGKAHPVAMDVSRGEETAAQVAQLDGEVGFDLVLANAGIGSGGRLVSETTFSQAAAVVQTNLTGALATLLPVVPSMIARFEKGGRRGHIAAVSSIGAEIAIPAAADYAASKAALSFYLEAAQGELPGRGVDVTIIHPGFVKSELTAGNEFPMPFLMELDDAAVLIDEALRQRAAKLRFPAGLALLSSLGGLVPIALRGRLVQRSARNRQ